MKRWLAQPRASHSRKFAIAERPANVDQYPRLREKQKQ
jgi:hypothetical protein